ncbi:hypothetical protein ASF69_04560 [Rhizobium sp. Leaf311]|uniref:hypothetical protein n=1 Tax=Rhizobium sp. Leaf311 TaxID=1736332 RepID=UPI0007159542|nr:hypothetical protein [Rhizobium sp. Leaf311]KQQ46504.1 hypothetical protein ASF69_04560 [Rhizobium sp. Leaf311]
MSYAELIEQLESAKEPSRWIDARIDAALRLGAIKMQGDGQGYDWAWDNFPTWAAHKKARGMCGVQHDNGDLGLVWDSMELTASVDASLRLLKVALPGWYVENLCQWEATVLRERGEWMCDLVAPQKPGEGRVHSKCAHAPSPAIALCIAILKAKQSQEVAA